VVDQAAEDWLTLDPAVGWLGSRCLRAWWTQLQRAMRASAHQLHVLTVLYAEVGELFSFPLTWPAEHGESMETMRRRRNAIFRGVVARGATAQTFRSHCTTCTVW
jgi:hypothetical protein